MDREDQFTTPLGGWGPIAELEALDREVDGAPDLTVLKQLFYRLESIIQQHPSDAGVQEAAAKVKQRILTKGMQLKQLASSPGPATTPLPAPPPPYVPPPASAPTVTVYGPGAGRPAAPDPQAAPAAPAQGSPFAPPAPAAPQPAPRPAAAGVAWKRALLFGGLIGVILFAAMVWSLKRASRHAEAPRPGLASVQIRTTPPGATIRIDNEVRCTSNCTIELPAGSYQLRATLEGYDPAATEVKTQAGAPVEVNLTLNPQGQIVRLLTDLQSGQVQLNGQPAGDLEDGQLILERVPAGSHTIKVSGRGSEASFSFEVVPGGAPSLTGPITTRNLAAIVLATAGDRGRLYSSVVPAKVSLGGRAAGEVGGGGLELSNLTAGDNELVLDDGKTPRKMVVSFGPAPVLTAFLKLDLNAGTLVVAASEDDATVYLNGKPYTGRKTSRGQLRLRALGVGKYSVRVAKEGFLDEPEQQVEIRKGEESRLEFRLRPVPRMATLRISGAAPGTRVFSGGEPLGEVQADGSFSAQVAPGPHGIELRRQGFGSRELKRQFTAGETVLLSGADVTLEKLPGLVRVSVVPADAVLTWRRAGEAQGKPVTQNPLRLPEGTYMITGSSPGYADGSVSVQLAPGESKTVEIKLVREQAAAPPPVKALGMEAWEAPSDWKQQGNLLVHTGGNFVGLKAASVEGTLEFTIALLKGRRLRWAVHWTDSRNHALFEMDRRHFYRKDVSNGRTTDLSRIEHGLAPNSPYPFQIEVAPGSVIHRVQRGGRWEVLDAWTQPGRDFTKGRFGLLIPGNDQFGISNFSFRPR